MDLMPKKCRYCGKEVNNLVGHIIRIHPQVADKIEETNNDNSPLAPQTPQTPPDFGRVSQNFPAQNIRIGGISQLIQEKLDIMLNIKIIEMLSRSPDTSIQEIAQAINPPKNLDLEQLKEYHDLVYGKDPPYVETGNQWLDIAQQAIPIVKEMLPKRKNQLNQEGDLNVRGGEEINPGLLKPIQQEAAGDPIKPGSDREKPGITSDTKQ